MVHFARAQGEVRIHLHHIHPACVNGVSVYLVRLHVARIHVVRLHVVRLHVVRIHVVRLHVVRLHLVRLHVVRLHVVRLYVVLIHVVRNVHMQSVAERHPSHENHPKKIEKIKLLNSNSFSPHILRYSIH